MSQPWHHTLALAAALATTTQAASPGYCHGTATEQQSGVSVEHLNTTTQQWDGAPLPSYLNGPPEIQVLRITIPAGVTLPWHHHPVINAAYVLRGRLRVELRNGQSRIISAGQTLVEVVNTVHRGQALPDSDAEVVVFYAGTTGTPITVLNPVADGGAKR